MKAIRLLRAEEIECRVGTISAKGLSLLLFKDARVDQKLLDETFTPMGWRRSHQEIGGNLYCTVSVWDKEKEQWIDKQDVGTMGNSEKEKSQASDSFKRACFNWGIGRELYTAPFIWVPADRVRITANGERFSTNERFRVASISYSGEREISALSVEDSKGNKVYDYKIKQPGRRASEPGKGIQEDQMTALEKELARTGVALEAVLGRYRIGDPKELTPEMYQDAMSGLKKSKSRTAA